MRVKQVAVTTAPASLGSLLDKQIRHTGSIGLQAPEGNVDIIYFGDKNEQPFELRPEANALLPVTSFKEVYVRGTPPDLLSVGLF